MDEELRQTADFAYNTLGALLAAAQLWEIYKKYRPKPQTKRRPSKKRRRHKRKRK